MKDDSIQKPELNFKIKWSNRHKEIADWLSEHAPQMLSSFEGALLLLQSPTIPGEANFISHAVRDLIQHLPSALDGAQEVMRHAGEIYPAKIKEIQKHWPNELRRKTTGDNVLIPHQAVSSVDDLLGTYQAVTSQVTSAEKLAKLLVNASDIPIALTQQLIDTFDEERKWFVNLAHFAVNARTEVSKKELNEHFENFCRAIHSIIGSYYIGIDELDAIIARNDLSDLPKVLSLIGSQHHARYFFDKLTSPDWATPLNEKGVFQDVPKPELVDNGVRHPACPALNYLERISGKAPDVVADIFQELEFENVNAISALVGVSKAVGTSQQIKLRKKLVKVARDQGFGIHAIDLCDVILNLIENGENKAAFMLARPLVEVSYFNETSAYQPARWYFEIWEKIAPKLLEADTGKFLKCAVHFLFEINEQKKGNSDWDENYDASFMWRPAIEPHRQNSDYSFESKFVDAVRDVFETAIRKKFISIESLLDLVRSKSKRVLFVRFELHLLSVFGEQQIGLAASKMLDRDNLRNYRVKHEYAMLCKNLLPLLGERQSEWFDLVDQGPDMSKFDANFKGGTGNEPTNEDRTARIEYWKLEKLHNVREVLEGEQAAEHLELLEKHGEPCMADMNIRSHVSGWGTTSPISNEALQQMSFPDAIEWISKWEPKGHSEPSLEGLEGAFKQYVLKDPNAAIPHAELLIEKRLGFVRTFLDCVSETQELTADPTAALDLCEWVISKSTKQGKDSVEFRPSEVTSSVSRFVRSICNRDVNIRFRKRIWALVSDLCNFEGPSNILESDDFDPRNRDFHLAAINSPSGHAFQAVFAYANWVSQSLFGKDRPEAGFNELPELRQLIEDRLSSNDSGGFNLRAIIGENAGFLRWLDQNWFEANRNRIFNFSSSDGDETKGLGWAAWNSFLFSTIASHDNLHALLPQFEEVATLVRNAEVDANNRDDPFSRAGQYLVIAYLNGQMEIDADSALLPRFLLNSPRVIRSRVFEFTGTVLGSDEDVAPEILSRYERLWDWYWKKVGRADAKSDPKSSVFGSWFISENLTPEWALSRLFQFVEVVPSPEPDHEIFGTLAKVCKANLDEAGEILKRLVGGYRENWQIYGSRDEIHQILRRMIGDKDVKITAIQIINDLGRMGFSEYRELID